MAESSVRGRRARHRGRRRRSGRLRRATTGRYDGRVTDPTPATQPRTDRDRAAPDPRGAPAGPPAIGPLSSRGRAAAGRRGPGRLAGPRRRVRHRGGDRRSGRHHVARRRAGRVVRACSWRPGRPAGRSGSRCEPARRAGSRAGRRARLAVGLAAPRGAPRPGRPVGLRADRRAASSARSTTWPRCSGCSSPLELLGGRRRRLGDRPVSARRIRFRRPVEADHRFLVDRVDEWWGGRRAPPAPAAPLAPALHRDVVGRRGRERARSSASWSGSSARTTRTRPTSTWSRRARTTGEPGSGGRSTSGSWTTSARGACAG